MRASSRSTPSSRRISVSPARAVPPISANRAAPAADSPGVVTGSSVVKAFTDELVAAVGLHRAWGRA